MRVGGKSWGRITENVSRALAGGVQVEIRVNVNRENLGEAARVVDVFRRLGWTEKNNFSYHFKATTPLVDAKAAVTEREVLDALLRSGMAGATTAHPCASEEMEAIWREAAFASVAFTLSEATAYRRYLSFGSAHCGAEQGMVLVDPAGLLYSCWDTVGMEERAIGRVDREAGAFVWNLEKIRWQARTIDHLEVCQSCSYALFCRGGCAGDAMRAFGDFRREYCGEFREIWDFTASRFFGALFEKYHLRSYMPGFAGLTETVGEDGRRAILAARRREEILRVASPILGAIGHFVADAGRGSILLPKREAEESLGDFFRRLAGHEEDCPKLPAFPERRGHSLWPFEDPFADAKASLLPKGTSSASLRVASTRKLVPLGATVSALSHPCSSAGTKMAYPEPAPALAHPCASAEGDGLAEKEFHETVRKAVALSRWVQEAEAIVVGAGAGLSAAAGLAYDDAERFQKYFSDFGARYGFSDMYAGGYHPYETAEEFWAYWSRYILVSRYETETNGLYETLLSILRDRNYFILTTNVDHQFQRAGFDKERLFYMQGDFGLLQCSLPCHHATYDGEALIREMARRQKDCRVPRSLLPRCPRCGRPMAVNVRSDDTFVKDVGRAAAKEHYLDFLMRHRGSRMLFWEMGVGASSPGIIRRSFQAMTAELPKARYAAIDRVHAFAPEEIASRSMALDMEIACILYAMEKIGQNGGSYEGQRV